MMICAGVMQPPPAVVEVLLYTTCFSQYRKLGTLALEYAAKAGTPEAAAASAGASQVRPASLTAGCSLPMMAVLSPMVLLRLENFLLRQSVGDTPQEFLDLSQGERSFLSGETAEDALQPLLAEGSQISKVRLCGVPQKRDRWCRMLRSMSQLCLIISVILCISAVRCIILIL